MTPPPAVESPEFETIKDLLGTIQPVATGYKILEFIYTFGKTNRIELALDKIQAEIDQIKVALGEVNDRLNGLTEKVVKAENLARTRQLENELIDLLELGFQLGQSPDDQVVGANVAHAAGLRADAILADEDLWLWSDVMTITAKDEDGHPIGAPKIEPKEPDFKTNLALPVYSMALMIWVAGISVDTKGNRQAVVDRYGDKLDKHIAAVSVRQDWEDDGTGAVTLPEKIRTRITCHPVAESKFAEQGICTFSIQCEDEIQRTRTVVRDFQLQMPDATALCTVDPNSVVGDEHEIENEDPTIKMLALWEEILRTIRASGHMPTEQVPGTFPTTEYFFPALYAIDGAGAMDFRTQIFPGDGSWSSPVRVGSGWEFDTVVPGGLSAILAKSLDQWSWFWHEGAEHNPATDNLRGPVAIGQMEIGVPLNTEWNLLGAGHGIVYGIVTYDVSGGWTVGDLYWNRFEGYKTGEGGFSHHKQVGNGWDGFLQVFAGGEGVLYGVQPNGVLRWYRHTGWEKGTDDWESGRDLDSGIDWSQFARIVPAGEGMIYGIFPNGEARAYRHADWQTGGNRFEGPQDAGGFWGEYSTVFASMPGEYVPVVK